MDFWWRLLQQIQFWKCLATSWSGCSWKHGPPGHLTGAQRWAAGGRREARKGKCYPCDEGIETSCCCTASPRSDSRLSGWTRVSALIFFATGFVLLWWGYGGRGTTPLLSEGPERDTCGIDGGSTSFCMGASNLPLACCHSTCPIHTSAQISSCNGPIPAIAPCQ